MGVSDICRLRQMEEENQSWSMDFVSDQLCTGHVIRVLTLVDNQECLNENRSLNMADAQEKA